MASALKYYRMFIFLLVINGYLFLTSYATPTLLGKVCNKTRDIEFCLNVFGSDPTTRTASLSELGKIAINKATDKAGETRTEINKLLFFASDPKLKGALTQCLHAYYGALAALRIALKDLREAHYADLYRHADDASQGAIACEQAFVDVSLPSPLTRDNVQLGDYCNIIQVISNASLWRLYI